MREVEEVKVACEILDTLLYPSPLLTSSLGEWRQHCTVYTTLQVYLRLISRHSNSALRDLKTL